MPNVAPGEVVEVTLTYFEQIEYVDGAFRVMVPLQLDGTADMRLLATLTNWAKNARVGATGYSPSRWVLGRGIRMPWQVLDEGSSARLASNSYAVEGFSRRMRILSAARAAFEAMDSSETIRRAMQARSRTIADGTILSVGDTCYFWRKVRAVATGVTKTRKKTKALVRAHWFGPATVIGKEGQSVWLSYRGKATKVAAEMIRRASVEQMTLDMLKGETQVMEELLKTGASFRNVLLEEKQDVLLPHQGRRGKRSLEDTRWMPKTLVIEDVVWNFLK